MKTRFFVLLAIVLCFIISCGGSGDGGSGESSTACASNEDCPFGKVCSSGKCVVPGSEEDKSGEGSGGDGSGDENGSEEDGSGNGSEEGSGDSDGNGNGSGQQNGGCSSIKGHYKPNETESCDYQGPEGTEGVGPCRASVRTCKENGTWSACDDSEVLPVAENNEELCSNGIDDDCDGKVDEQDSDCKGGSGSNNNNGEDEEEDDSDVEHCDTVCLTPITDDGCLPAMASEKDKDLCNGLDDDCDGTIDEGCPCNLGDTQACFSGKPAQRNVGTCADGIQTCKMGPMKSVTGTWGECKGEILPKKDVCDNADNNCNGCKDEGLCCAPAINCDYDIGHATPFVPMEIDGTKIYDIDHKFNDADSVKWEWTLTKGNCDVVLKTTTFSLNSAVAGVAGTTTDAKDRITFSGIGLSKFNVKFQLSGTYNLHLKITREGDPESPYECEWPLKVLSDGVRVELCWSSYSSVDIDLHVGKNGKTTKWSPNTTADYVETGCCFNNCKYNASQGVDWGYANTDTVDKYGNSGNFRNPRLDIDNTGGKQDPENINIDNPEKGDKFRVGAYWWAGNKTTYPVVNVYCGGTIKGTYGGEISDSGTFNYTVTNFDGYHDFWKVVEIEWKGKDTEEKCVLTPKTDGAGGYVVKDGSVPSPYETDW